MPWSINFALIESRMVGRARGMLAESGRIRNPALPGLGARVLSKVPFFGGAVPGRVRASLLGSASLDLLVDVKDFRDKWSEHSEF